MPKTEVNPTIQDYLRSVYRLEMRDGKSTNAALAKDLNISSAAVTEMVRRLAGQDLLRYEKYRGPTLTESGRKIALNTTRRHRLWEVFLIRHLGFEWDQVHEIADELEHIGGEGLVDRLDRFLGHPTHDPHGDPIPSKDGVLPEEGLVAISLMEAGAEGTVRRVNDDVPELLRYAASLGLNIGSRLKVIGVIAFDSSVRLRSNGSDVVVSGRLADNVFIKPDQQKSPRKRKP